MKDADKLASDAVQKDITALKKYQAATKDISATLVSLGFNLCRIAPSFVQTKYLKLKLVLLSMNSRCVSIPVYLRSVSILLFFFCVFEALIFVVDLVQLMEASGCVPLCNL